jgi:excisionase family DNA binding protein
MCPACWIQVYDGALAATLPRGWRNLGVWPGRRGQVVASRLTTQQAADFLNVSRPYLIGLLEADEIPYRRVGTHRRIRFEDLREYRRRDDLKRLQAADELTQLSQELGLY